MPDLPRHNGIFKVADMKRLLYLDVLRGFMICYVIFIHALIFRVFDADYGYLNLLPPWVIVLLSPLLIIGMWGSIFAGLWMVWVMIRSQGGLSLRS